MSYFFCCSCKYYTSDSPYITSITPSNSLSSLSQTSQTQLSPLPSSSSLSLSPSPPSSLSSSSLPSPIKRSPSHRFPILSPSIMKVLAPNIEMPSIECENTLKEYRNRQNHVINHLMGFLEEESIK